MAIMNVLEVDEGTWPWFLEQTRGKELDHYWFVVDWLSCRNDSRIWAATRDGRMAGALLLFRGTVCQLRGERDAAAELVKFMGDDVAEAVVPIECGDLIEGRYQVKRTEDILMMTLPQGSQRLMFMHETERLGPKDTDDIVVLLREADPVIWGDVTHERMRDWTTLGVWYGARNHGGLVAAAGSWFTGETKLVNIVAVAAPFRGTGLGRSVLSRLLKDIFEVSDLALIHVRADNVPALRAYKAVGYRPYQRYRRFVMRR